MLGAPSILPFPEPWFVLDANRRRQGAAVQLQRELADRGQARAPPLPWIGRVIDSKKTVGFWGRERGPGDQDTPFLLLANRARVQVAGYVLQ